MTLCESTWTKGLTVNIFEMDMAIKSKLSGHVEDDVQLNQKTRDASMVVKRLYLRYLRKQ
jgi:hypothetical protein